MKRAVWITLLGVMAFAVILIARLPASWVVPAPPSSLACTDSDGTIWSGTCMGLTSEGQPLGDLSWRIHALRLLGGKLEAAVVLTRPSGGAHGTIEMGLNRNITARDVHADLPLERGLLPQLPPHLHGDLHADLDLVRVAGRAVRTLQGRIEARHLQLGEAPNLEPLGSYSLTFPPGKGDPVGQLRDLGGPLAVEGSLRLTGEPGFDLEGLVSARAEAPPGLARDIQFLGSPDPQGRRPFSMAATF